MPGTPTSTTVGEVRSTTVVEAPSPTVPLMRSDVGAGIEASTDAGATWPAESVPSFAGATVPASLPVHAASTTASTNAATAATEERRREGTGTVCTPNSHARCHARCDSR